MILDMLNKGFNAVTSSFSEFQGSGLIFILFLISILFIACGKREKNIKDIFVKYPVYVLIVFFVPIWYVYIYYFSDYEILYRILWLLPIGVTVCYVLIEVIYKLPEKFRTVGFVAAILLLVISVEYTYSNEYFSFAENEYHIPQIVVDICDETEVEGREIRIAVPDELLSYVRQYTNTIWLPYGRETLMGLGSGDSLLRSLLSEPVIDTKAVVEELRHYETPYLIVRDDTKFTESLADYDYVYVTSYDNYDMYMDNDTYYGIDDIDYR